MQDRFDPIVDQDIGMAGQTADDFCARQQHVRHHPDKRDTRARSQIAGRTVRGRMRSHRMSGSTKAIVYHAHGNPAEVLRLEQSDLAPPAADEALVQILAAPINPADVNAIEGKYPVRPALPATPGFEGAGVVLEIGRSVRDLAVGAHVILPHDLGSWREAAVVKAEKLVAVPNEIEPEQAAMLKINPLTAWRMLHDFVRLEEGDWVIQNAANSAAGRAAIQIARQLAYRTVNVVRRPELIEELQAEGGDLVLVDHEKLRDEVREKTGGAPIRLALNAVGGESALRLANCLAPEGTMVTYGAMSLQPLRLPNGLLIFKNLRFTGFWVNKWYDGASRAERSETFARLFDFAQRGLLRTKVERSYSLGEFAAA